MLLDAWFPPFCSLKWQKQGWADLALQGAKSYRAAWLIDDLHWKWFSFQNEFRNHWVHNMKPVSYCPWCYLFIFVFVYCEEEKLFSKMSLLTKMVSEREVAFLLIIPSAAELFNKCCQVTWPKIPFKAIEDSLAVFLSNI